MKGEALGSLSLPTRLLADGWSQVGTAPLVAGGQVSGEALNDREEKEQLKILITEAGVSLFANHW